MDIAYITTSFGALSHTFIRREVKELRRLGQNVYLYGIRPEIAEQLSLEDKDLAQSAFHLYPIKPFRVAIANVNFLLTSPLVYLKTLFTALLNEEKNLYQHIKLIYHFWVSSYIAQDMKKRNISHIHAHFLNVPATIAMYCAQLLGISFSVTIHSSGIATLKEMIALKTKLKLSKFLCTISHHLKNYIDKAIYSCAEKTTVVHCGIKLDDYCPTTDLEINEGNLRILAVGRFEEKKGFRYLIEAAHILKQEKFRFLLTLIGDGSLRKDLEQQAVDNSLEKHVIFKGALSQEQVMREFCQHDILVVPSTVASSGEMEGIPVVIMEAMAIGIPVIASEHSGIPELVRHEKTGLLVAERNPLEISLAIKRLGNDRELCRELIANGQKIIAQEFDIKTIAQQKKNLFEAVK